MLCLTELQCCTMPFVAWAVRSSITPTKASTDIAEGLVLVAPKVPGVSRAELTEFLEQMQLGLDVPVLSAEVLQDKLLQSTVAVGKLPGSLSQGRARRLVHQPVALSQAVSSRSADSGSLSVRRVVPCQHW